MSHNKALSFRVYYIISFNVVTLRFAATAAGGGIVVGIVIGGSCSKL